MTGWVGGGGSRAGVWTVGGLMWFGTTAQALVRLSSFGLVRGFGCVCFSLFFVALSR